LDKRHGVDECVEQSDGVFMGARGTMNVAIAAVPGCAEDAEDSEGNPRCRNCWWIRLRSMRLRNGHKEVPFPNRSALSIRMLRCGARVDDGANLGEDEEHV